MDALLTLPALSPSVSPPMPRWQELVHLSEEALTHTDIAAVQLTCAEGLPGSEKIDRQLCLRTIDRMAERTRIRTQNASRAFQQCPEKWQGSEGIFRMHVMVCTLGQEFGVRYNPAKIPEDAPFDPEDSYVHGIIQGQGGTCASLPVLYIAVGRRLGYPLHLVSAQGPRWGHFFARWEEPGGERFNVEINNTGLNCPPDDHYREGFYKSCPEWEAGRAILTTMTRREEVASFMAQRSADWHELTHRLRAESLAWACSLAPTHPGYRGWLRRALHEWHETLEPREPPGFPPVHLFYGPRRFPPSLPFHYERDIIGLSVTEFLLADPINIRNYWEPLRQGRPPRKQLTGINVHCTANGYRVQLLDA